MIEAVSPSGSRILFLTQAEVDTIARGETWEGLPEWTSGCHVRPISYASIRPVGYSHVVFELFKQEGK